MSARNYAVQKPNATAVNMLRSWLKSAGIGNKPSESPGFDLTVATAGGGELEVQVCLRRDETMPGEGVQVVAGDVTGKKLASALAAFWRVTDAAGHEHCKPFERGAEPEANAQGNPRKLHYRDDEFLVAIRHTEFRRSPNPDPERFQHYRATMEKVSWSFVRLNFELCQRHGVDIDDVMTLARCYVVNFCARYETPNEVFHDNERKCYAYIRQRLNSDFLPILRKKQRSMLPDAETVSIGLYGRPNTLSDQTAVLFPKKYPNPEIVLQRYVYPELGQGITEHDREDADADEDYVRRHCVLDTSSPSARRASAAALLRDLLGDMPHDDMVETLRAATENHSLDVVARREAARQLRLHSGSCAACGSGDLGVEEDEELAGEDAGCAQE